MTEEQKEALDAVNKINDKLVGEYSECDNLEMVPMLSITFVDVYFFISISIPDEFNGQEIKLFNSENNDRVFYEKTNEYETIYDTITRRFLQIKKQIRNIKW